MNITSQVPGVHIGSNTIQQVPSPSKVSRKVAQLPAHFLEVLLAVLRKNEPLAQNTGGNIKSNLFVLGRGYERERGWLQNIRELCKEELAKDDAGYCT